MLDASKLLKINLKLPSELPVRFRQSDSSPEKGEVLTDSSPSDIEYYYWYSESLPDGKGVKSPLASFFDDKMRNISGLIVHNMRQY